jgi:hypothetical protein
LFAIPCGGFSRQWETVFEEVGFGFEGVGKRLEMAAFCRRVSKNKGMGGSGIDLYFSYPADTVFNLIAVFGILK